MAMRSPTDPRLPRGESDIRPVVAMPSAGLPIWAIALGFAVLAIVLFVVLDARRRTATAPPVKPRYDDGVAVQRQTPSLFIPPAPVPSPIATPMVAPPPKPPPFIPPPPPPQIIYVPQPALPAAIVQPPPHTSNDPVLVIDTGTAPAPNIAPVETGQNAAEAGARATVVRHQSTMVPQGTVIPAVLESALDSTRAGPVRALVSRDVRGFDGTRILVPRGSRLFGDYRADLQPGQNRALVMWTRLVRPDGTTIALASPASDPLGRAGIRGQVNSHFLERFGSAILQSALEIGVNRASRLGSGDSTVLLAVPGTTQALSQPFAQGAQIRPTLRVRQGTQLSVFVARDLDFSAVEAGK